MGEDILTPDQIARELRAITAAIESAPDVLKRAEARSAAADDAWQAAWDEGFRDTTGTIAEREIAGRTAAENLKDVVNEERAELSRVKQKIRSLDSLQSNLQTQLKAVLVTYEQAGR